MGACFHTQGIICDNCAHLMPTSAASPWRPVTIVGHRVVVSDATTPAEDENKRLRDLLSRILGDEGPDLDAYVDGHVEAPSVPKLRQAAIDARKPHPRLTRERDEAQSKCDSLHKDLGRAYTELQDLHKRLGTMSQAKSAWEQIFSERSKAWQDAEEKLGRVRDLLDHNGCDCECDPRHDHEPHRDDCDPCLACQIDQVVGQ